MNFKINNLLTIPNQKLEKLEKLHQIKKSINKKKLPNLIKERRNAAQHQNSIKKRKLINYQKLNQIKNKDLHDQRKLAKTLFEHENLQYVF
jgi:hypothetical protein